MSCIFPKNSHYAILTLLYILPSELLHPFSPLQSPTPKTFYPFSTSYPLFTSYSTSYLIFNPLEELILHCFSPSTRRQTVLNLKPLYRQPIIHNIQTNNACPTLGGPSMQIIFVRIIPSEKIIASLLDHFNPLDSPILTSFCPFSTKFLLTLTSTYPPWQPN